MTKPKIILLSAVAIFAILFVYYCNAYPFGSWRYKVTVVVETPEGIKTGSAVRQMSHWTPPVNFPNATDPAKIKGEAVVVDLGERGKLFALLSKQSGQDFYRAFPVRDAKKRGDGIRYYKSLTAGTKSKLKIGEYPEFVTFTDIQDPKTIKKVIEMETDGEYPLTYTVKEDHIEEYFGDGVAIKEVSLEITDEPITWGRIDSYITTSEKIFYSVGSHVFKKR